MFRKLFPWFITLFMALVDTSVVPFLTNSPFTPLFSLTTIVALGLLLGRRRGALLGLMAGLAVDILVNEPYGLMTIIFTGAGFVSGFAGRKFMNHMWTTVLTPVAVFALMEGILFLYQAFAPAGLWRGARGHSNGDGAGTLFAVQRHFAPAAFALRGALKKQNAIIWR